MYKNRYFLLILVATLGLQGCESLLENPEPRFREIKIQETYTTYNYVPANKKEFVLNENFNNSANGWQEEYASTDYEIAIYDGVLHASANSYTKVKSTIALSNFDVNGNFEIEAYIKVVDDYYNNGNILLWGYNSTVNQYNFVKINDTNRQITIGNNTGNNTSTNYLSDYYSSSWYREGSYNKYTVRKAGKIYYYFVNETFLYQETANSFYGTKIGFQIGGYSGIEADWLTVKKLNI